MKLYAQRNPQELEPHYSNHVSAMTLEKLHSKSDIAGELAWRDKEIEILLAKLKQLKEIDLFLNIIYY